MGRKKPTMRLHTTIDLGPVANLCSLIGSRSSFIGGLESDVSDGWADEAHPSASSDGAAEPYGASAVDGGSHAWGVST
jgi:hypothetical protein